MRVFLAMGFAAVLLAGCGSNRNCKDACDKLASCKINQAGLACDANCDTNGVGAAQATCAECLNGHSCDDISAGKCASECAGIQFTHQ